MPPVIANKNFLKLWFAQITSQIALNALYFILTLKIYEITHSNTAVSLLILAFTVPSIFFGYLAGVYVDQLSLKQVMLLTNLVRSVVILLILIFIAHPLTLFGLVLILAIATLFFVPAEGSAIPSLVGEEELISANSLFSLTLQSAVVIGFLVGGFALKLLGEPITILAIFVLFATSLVLNLFLPNKIQSYNKAEAQEGFLGSFLRGIAFVVSTKIVRDAVFFLTLTTTIIFVLATIGPGYVDKVLHLDINYAAAFIVAPATLGMVVGSLVIGHIGVRQDQRKLVNLGLMGMGITFLILAFLGQEKFSFRTHLFALFFIFLLGVENALISIPVTTDFQKNTPEEFRGRAYGLLSTFISGVAALPVLISGAIADLFSVKSVLVTMGLVVLSVGLYRLRPKKV